MRLADADAAVQWLRGGVAASAALRTDSRAVRPGDAFLAWPGRAHDGRRFVGAALRSGAARCLIDDGGLDAAVRNDDGLDASAFDDVRLAAMPQLKAAAGPIADRWYGAPSAAIPVIAVTGTNGKTSVAWWTAQALSALGRRCGVIGTLGVGEPPRAGDAAHTMDPTGLTTPDAVMLHAVLRRFVDTGIQACAMEASSIGIDEHRIDGTRIALALFTNLTRDHLDYHGTMEHYRAAKQRLFHWPGLRAAVINIDDEVGAALADELARGGRVDVWTTSIRGAARIAAQGLRYADGGLAFDLVETSASAAVRTSLIGDYNASNLLAVIGALRALGHSLADAVSTVSHLVPVPGRLQRVAHGTPAPLVVVDYAHTPDALEKALHALRPLADSRGGRLWCVFGCGGNRDATKRPLMGAIARRQADEVVLTSDNPRDESPTLILAQIMGGMSAVRPPEGARSPSGGPAEGRRGQDPPDAQHAAVIEDRRAAIDDAVRRAAAADVILLAGKGHETTQEVAGVKKPFDDVEVALAALRARASGARA
ncbi:MAG: UDP-N-acetylmuramoyl-L-alanyl-D-glutamate--2,6-diaminopimelate ligase [Burkholderiaceae bacterium]